MSNTPRDVTRNQLAAFLPNQRTVRAFEQMLKQVNELLPADIITLNRLIEEASIEAAEGTSKAQVALDLFYSALNDSLVNTGTADAKATQALESLSRIAHALELLSAAPAAAGSNSIALDYIDFNVNPRYAPFVGRVHWGSTGTLEIEMGGGNITQQVGEEFFVYGKASAAITEGQLIMVTGTVGASGAVKFAPTSTGLTDPNAILGIATENIALNGFGRVTTMGVVHGLDTSGASVGEVWADGDVLWYNTGFVGGMTNVKPSAPNMKTQVAIVLRAGGGASGSLQVEVIHGSTLGGTDTNVQLSALADKQLLQYDIVAGYWKNVAATAVAIGVATNLAGGVAGSVPYQTAANTTAMLAIGSALQVLQTNAGATAPEWVSSTGTGSVARASLPTFSTTIGVGGAAASASGSGVTFPAAFSGSSNANTLDDYEEGTWTPSDASGASLVFTSPSGYYTKIGDTCIAWGRTTYPVTASGLTALIGGLPFAAQDNNQPGGGFTRLTDSGRNDTLSIGATTANLTLYNNALAAASNANYSGKRIDFIIVYKT